MLIYISSKNVISLWCYMIDLQLRKTSLANKLIIYSTQRYFSIHSLNDNWVINQVCITHKFRLISSLHDSKTEEWYLELSYDDIETQWRSMFMWETSKKAITYHTQNRCLMNIKICDKNLCTIWKQNHTDYHNKLHIRYIPWIRFLYNGKIDFR